MTTVDKYKVNIYDAAGNLLSSFGGAVLPTNLSPALATVGVLNGDLLVSTDVSSYRSLALQITAIGSLTVQVQFSLDNTNWDIAIGRKESTGLGVNGITAIGVYIYEVPPGARCRIRITSYASGTVTGAASFSSFAVPPTFVGLQLANNGNDGQIIQQLADFSGNARPLAVGTYNYNGASSDRVRTPTVFKDISAVAIGTITTLWTPAGGKKFRLMGGVLSASAAVNVLFEDNAGGAFILRLPKLLVDTPFAFTLGGNGFLSAAANNVLKATSSAAANITGTVYGTEE
jgi:hypothetical protein